jgi:hypothetical protein
MFIIALFLGLALVWTRFWIWIWIGFGLFFAFGFGLVSGLVIVFVM